METINDIETYTFPALLKNSVKKFGERDALALVGKTPITYKEVKEKSVEVSKLLEGFGLKKGSKVAIYATGRPEWGVSYFGIVNRGMIAVPLLPDFSSTEVAAIVEHCGLDAFVVEQKLYDKLKDIHEKLPAIVIKIEDFSILKGENVQPVSELPAVDVLEDDTASIIYTSGTTGRSKGVELTHCNLVWNAVQCQTVHRVNGAMFVFPANITCI